MSIDQRLLGVAPELRRELAAAYARLEGKEIAPVSPGTPVNALAATGTLSVAANPSAGETITIGSRTYTFVANGTVPLADGDIELEALVAGTQPKIVAAINGSDGHNTANPHATAGAFAANDSVITASVRGAAGNLIATTETMAGAGNQWAAATLAGGVNGTVGEQWEMRVDASWLYVAVAANTTADRNWRRITLGAAY